MGVMRMDELVVEARLPDARLADDRDELPAPATDLVPGAAELIHLSVTTDEARQPPPRRGFEAAAGRARSRQLEHLDRLADPLDRDRPERGDMHHALGQVQGAGGEPDAAGRRELLHACRQVRGVAHRGVVHAQIAADRAHDDVSGVEADPDLHLHALGAPQLVRVAPHGVLHPERGIARAHGVILVGEGSAEERHDAVPHHLVDGALVAMDGVHHALE